jgi:ribosomal protein S18 acetylase RimI-like enzyme
MDPAQATIERLPADAEPAAVHAALDLVLRQLPADVREPFRTGLVEQWRGDPASLGELWRAVDRAGTTIGGVWGQTRPGGATIVWPPQWRDGVRSAGPDPLLSALLTQLIANGTTLAQSLLGDRESADAAALTGCGFRHLADLHYLSAPATIVTPTTAATELEFVPVDGATWQPLARVVERTFVATLDCPSLHDVRSGEAMLDEYRAVGDSGPTLWRLIRQAGRDVGCLILAEHGPQDQIELVYIGIVPEARGRNWGESAVREALRMAAERGRARVVTAVDAANWPAVALYERCGFAVFEARSVFVCELAGPSATT